MVIKKAFSVVTNYIVEGENTSGVILNLMKELLSDENQINDKFFKKIKKKI